MSVKDTKESLIRVLRQGIFNGTSILVNLLHLKSCVMSSKDDGRFLCVIYYRYLLIIDVFKAVIGVCTNRARQERNMGAHF